MSSRAHPINSKMFSWLRKVQVDFWLSCWQRHRWPRGVEESPILEVFKEHGDVALGDVVSGQHWW